MCEPTCINLRRKYGGQFKVVYEESYKADRGDGGRVEAPWLMQLLCKYGHIYPHGGQMLGVATNRRGGIGHRLAALPCVKVTQDGDDGLNAIFNVADFETVAAIARPRLRRKGRKLSAAEKQKLAATGRAALRKYQSTAPRARSKRKVRMPSRETTELF